MFFDVMIGLVRELTVLKKWEIFSIFFGRFPRLNN